HLRVEAGQLGEVVVAALDFAGPLRTGRHRNGQLQVLLGGEQLARDGRLARARRRGEDEHQSAARESRGIRHARCWRSAPVVINPVDYSSALSACFSKLSSPRRIDSRRPRLRSKMAFASSPPVTSRKPGTDRVPTPAPLVAAIERTIVRPFTMSAALPSE